MGNLDNPTYKNTMRRKLLNIMLLGACLASCGRQADSGVDYDLEPMPPVHSPLPENSVPMGDVATFAEEKLDLPVTPGPYEPTWSSIEANYPGTPQ